jgi:hypothetical protein
MRLFISRRRRISPTFVCALIGLGFLVGGCSEQGVASQDANAPVKIETSQLYVTVRNNSGLALDDVSLGIVPYARTTIYSKALGRLENAETRNIMLGEFVGRDGTPFSLRVAKPKLVEVKATDIKGQTYNLEAPWQ